ncbi:hypothetical protein ACWIID_15905 [Streptomyces phaeochromogenes]
MLPLLPTDGHHPHWDRTQPQPQSLTEVIEDAGHDVHLDRPRRLHAVVRTFLAATNTT